MGKDESAVVLSVSKDAEHRFTKSTCDAITLLEGLGVESDAHLGRTVQHRSRVAADPTQPNLRQVHLIQSELFDEVAHEGYTVLRIGAEAAVEITGLRNPCSQINDFQQGLMKAVIGYDDSGELIRKAGIMGVVVHSGVVRPGDEILTSLPAQPHTALERV